MQVVGVCSDVCVCVYVYLIGVVGVRCVVSRVSNNKVITPMIKLAVAVAIDDNARTCAWELCPYHIYSPLISVR